MKIVLSLCCVTLAMLLHPNVSNHQSEAPFRTINVAPSDFSRFDSMAITTSEDFKAFLEEMSQQPENRGQPFVDALLNAKIDFNREALVFLRHDEGSISARVSFETPVLQDKTLLCEIRGELLGMGLAVVGYHCFALAVSKSLVDKVQLNSVPAHAGSRRTIVLSTTDRQPLKMRRYPEPKKPSPGDCPKLTIDCPSDLLETGKVYEVKVVVEGGKPEYNITPVWSVQGGEIVEGQGTPTLKFRVTHPNQIVKAFVEVGGFNPYCDRLATCSCGPTR